MSSEDALRAFLERYQRRQQEMPQLVVVEAGPFTANAFSQNPTSISATSMNAWTPERMVDPKTYSGKC
jgi:hypothetical protein